MAHKKMYAVAPMRYGTRMLKAGEAVTMSGPEATLHTALGHVTAKRPARPKPVAAEPEPAPEPVDELTELRAAYQAKSGKRPFHGWDADALRERIAAAAT